MKLFTPEISWHEREPVYSCSFHPARKNVFATAGVTGVIRLWEILVDGTDKVQVSFLANLKRHTKGVNVIRWNHDGQMIASAGDEDAIFLWHENDIKNQKTLDNDEDESKENWFAFKTLRGHLEDVLDLCWSRDSTFLLSGSIDNSAILWNTSTGAKIAIVKEPKGFVQGVTFDPFGVYYAVMSTDRSLRFYNTNTNKCIFNVNRVTFNKENKENTDSQPQHSRMFHDDTMKSFFRRLCFSFDGNFILAPAGCLEQDDKIINVSYIFTRNCLNKPCAYLPHDKPSVAIAFCPHKFQLMKNDDSDSSETHTKNESPFTLPYRLVFAIVTEDSIMFYDTQHLLPFAYVTGIHYSNLTDLTWSMDGRMLAVSSIDGFCSFIMFNEGEFGEIYTKNENEITSTITSSNNNNNIEMMDTNSNSSTKSENEKKTEIDKKTEEKNTIKSFFTNMSNKSKPISTINNEKPTAKKEIEDIDVITIVPASNNEITSSNTGDKTTKRVKLVPIN